MNERIINRLIKICRKWHKEHSVRRPVHFTFILDGSRIVSMGVNKRSKTHPKSPHPFKSIHSELDAILNIKITDECKRFHFMNLAEFASKLELMNIRLLKNGDTAMAKPCKHCQRMVDSMGFKKISYTT